MPVTGRYGYVEDRDKPESDTSKSVSGEIRSICRATARTTTFDGIRHLHQARGRFI